MSPGNPVGISVRRATPRDATSIAEIYNHYIESSTATFDTAPKSAADRAEWIAARSESHPVMVAERDGAILAWGALSPFAARAAWDSTVEVAVYVAAGHVGHGIGPRLLEELVRSARDLGHHVLVSRIVSENAVSLRMTEHAGFRRVGVLHEVGRKFDRWLDVTIMELVLEE